MDRDDLGPVLPSRVAVHQQAREIVELGRLAMEFTALGPMCDLRRALVQLDRIRALLGEVRQ